MKVPHGETSLKVSRGEQTLREGYCGDEINHMGAVSVFDDDASEDGKVRSDGGPNGRKGRSCDC